MPLRILLDCDPGHDDVVAIIAAARYADLVGITTVAGNAPLDRTTYNACVMRDLLGLSAPVHAGAVRPLLAEPHPRRLRARRERARRRRPARRRRAAPTATTRSGSSSTRAAPRKGMWLVPTGPLTNIALAMRAAPDLTSRIAGVSLMGGGSFGNRYGGGRVQHLGRSRGGGDRVRVRRAARDGRARRHPSVPRHRGADRARSTPSAGSWRRCSPTCSASSPARTAVATSTWSAPPCTTRWRCSASPTASCSRAASVTSRSRPAASSPAA